MLKNLIYPLLLHKIEMEESNMSVCEEVLEETREVRIRALMREQDERMRKLGFVKFRLRSKDPNWSPENCGDHIDGDWGWKFSPNSEGNPPAA